MLVLYMRVNSPRGIQLEHVRAVRAHATKESAGMRIGQAVASAVYSEETGLEWVIETLKRAGFCGEAICVVLAPTHPIAVLIKAKLPQALSNGSAMPIGIVDWLVTVGAVVIPGIGYFICSQQYLKILMNSGEGARESGSLGLLASLGVSPTEALRLDRDLLERGALLLVVSQEIAESEWAREILLRTGAEEALCQVQEDPLPDRTTDWAGE